MKNHRFFLTLLLSFSVLATGCDSDPVEENAADLSITKTLETEGPYSAGQEVEFTLVVSNAGPSTATQIQITDTPTNLTITAVSGDACSELPCSIADPLSAGSEITITVRATIDEDGDFSNSATVSASEDDPDPENNTDEAGEGETAEPSHADAIFVGNQGTPASVTAIDPEAGTTTEHFRNQMSGFLQGMALMNDWLYVTGNTNSINVVDPETRQVVGQIQDGSFGTARYLTQVSANRAYVTTQNYDPEAEEAEVLVINLSSNTVVERIPVPLTSGSGNPDGIAVSNGKAFVAQGSFSAGTEVGVIDVATHTYSHAVDVECAARYLVVDNDGEVIGSCSDTQEIFVINPDTEDVTRVDAGGEIGSLFGLGQDAVVAEENTGEAVYFLSTELGIIAFDPDAHTVTGTIDIDTENAGSLGFDPQAETVHIGHADPDGPFSANGSVTVHELDGSEVTSYDAGVYPAYISVYASPELVAL